VRGNFTCGGANNILDWREGEVTRRVVVCPLKTGAYSLKDTLFLFIVKVLR
jgi:hypothetical protein